MLRGVCYERTAAQKQRVNIVVP